MPRTCIFLLEVAPTHQKSALNEKGNHQKVKEEFRNYLIQTVHQLVSHSLCNPHSKFSLKMALFLSKWVKNTMVTIFEFLLVFIHHFVLFLIILLIFTLMRSFKVHFFIKKGPNSLFLKLQVMKS